MNPILKEDRIHTFFRSSLFIQLYFIQKYEF